MTIPSEKVLQLSANEGLASCRETNQDNDKPLGVACELSSLLLLLSWSMVLWCVSVRINQSTNQSTEMTTRIESDNNMGIGNGKGCEEEEQQQQQ